MCVCVCVCVCVCERCGIYCIIEIEYYSAFKKKKILSFVTIWMNLEDIMLSELNQPQKDKYHMISLTHGI